MPKFEVIQGGEESASLKEKEENLLKELRRLIDDYACGFDVRPEWCVYGIGRAGVKGVLYWIRPSEEAKFVANQIARLETKLGGDAKAEKTEYHPEFKGTPKYRGEEHESFTFGK